MLGIDVSKATLTGTLLVTRDQPPVWAMTVPNTPAGITRLIQRSTPQDPWVVEPTGRYSQPLVVQARAAGRAGPARATEAGEGLPRLPLAARQDRSAGQLWPGTLWSGG